MDSNSISKEEQARLELYAALEKGLKDIEEGRTKTAEEVRQHMEKRRKQYLYAKL